MKKRYLFCLTVFLLLPMLYLTSCASGGSSSSDSTTSTDTSDNSSISTVPDPSVGIFINQVETECFSDYAEVKAYVSVIDEYGDFIDNLDLSNFQINHNSAAIVDENIYFTTVNSLIPDPVSASIIMDYSTSITENEATQSAMEDAVLQFIDLMQTDDQAEIIKFNTGIKYRLPFTSNKSLLIAGVAYSQDVVGGYTYLYDTLYTGVEDTAAQTGRKAVVALTDGVEKHTDDYTGDGRSLEDVVELAQAQEVPLFIIGLGSEVNADELEYLAEETSGHYYQAATSDELEAIYTSISELLNEGQYYFVYETDNVTDDTAYFEISVEYDGLTDTVGTDVTFCQ